MRDYGTFATLPQGAKVLSVGELNRSVQLLLEDAFPQAWVAGEVSNCKRHSSGHIYLSLKDADAQLTAVIWRSTALRLRFEPKDGQEVIARGRVTVYAARGSYQFVIDELHVKGLGARELALRQLKEKLHKLGYFAAERKRPLPRFPRRLGLVTSPTGAAVRDMLEVLGKRWSAAEVWVCPVRVQGDGAAEEIAAMLRRLNALHRDGELRLDVLILGRGGGSVEDLWQFNAECLAHAIFESRIPVVSAVGHEIDYTVADMVADWRALTPTQAATVVVPDIEELRNDLRDRQGRLRTAMGQLFEDSKRRLDDLAARRAFRLPLERVRDREQRLDDWGDRLTRAVRQRLYLAKQQLDGQTARLESLSPLNVLGRGYSLTRKEANLAVVRNAEQVRPGDLLVTTLERGQVVSRVEEARPAAS
jgi:exodeoxyribonuclease VII large subunit